jgi:hypothetical protein
MDYGLRGNRDPISIFDLAPGTVKDILVDGDDVYVAGNFYAWELANDQLVTQNNIARWSRTDNQWYGLNFGLASRKERRGSRYNGDVEALLRWNGDLYAAGRFSGSCVAEGCDPENFNHDYTFDHETLARWDGTQWNTADPSIERFLGVRESGAGLYALAEAPNGDLIAAGDVTELRKTDGSSLVCDGIFRIRASGGVGCLGGASVRNGTDGTVYALVVDPATGDLIVGGDFSVVDDDSEDGAPGTPAQNVARWDGSSWSAVGLGLDGPVRELRYRDGSIHAFGDFPTHAARLGGGGWETLGAGTPRPVAATTETSDGLVAVTDLLQTWDGTGWDAWGLGLNGPVYDIAVDPADQSVYVVGAFSGPPGARASDNIAQWDENGWQPVGGGITAGEFTLSAVAARGGLVYVGGDPFRPRQPDGTDFRAEGIARWDGSQWSTLADGVGGGGVSHIAVAENGDVYASGDFDGALPLEGTNIAEEGLVRWDGSQWRPTGGWAGTGYLEARGNGVYVAAGSSPADVFSDGLAYYRPVDGIRSRVVRPGDGDRPPTSLSWITFGGGLDGGAGETAWPFVITRGYTALDRPQVCTVDNCPTVPIFVPLSGLARRQGQTWVDLGVDAKPNHIAKQGETLFASFFGSSASPSSPFSTAEIKRRNVSQGGGSFVLEGTVEHAAADGIRDMESDGENLYIGGRIQRAGGLGAGGFAILRSGAPLTDTDGDGISDGDEAIFGSGSGGLDSDDDGLTDVEEAGDDLLLTPPIDTDSDGTPDFLDPDDDGDGIDTATEVADAGVHGDDPDGDGRPNWLDEDADGDTVLDEFEGTADNDSNGVPDYLDAGQAQLRLQADASNLTVPYVPGFYDVDLALSALSANTVLQVVRRAPGPTGLPAGQELAADRSWTLDFEQAVTFEADVCFDVLSVGLPETADLTRLKVYKRETDQAPWNELTTTLKPSATDPAQLCATGVTSFSEFVVTGAPDALPVELAAFTAVEAAEGVALTWQTASETENAGFHVQRQVGTGAFTDVHFAPGAGTTTAPQRYRFTDRSVPFAAEAVTYRLRQVDTDGTATLSDVVEVTRGSPDRLELLAPYPNPARSGVTLRAEVPGAAVVELAVYDVLGRRVAMLADEARSAGRVERHLDTSGWASGVYFVRLVAGGEVRTQRLTVVR